MMVSTLDLKCFDKLEGYLLQEINPFLFLFLKFSVIEPKGPNSLFFHFYEYDVYGEENSGTEAYV